MENLYLNNKDDMDFTGDYQALSGVGGFNPLNMIKAMQDISNALVNPYSNLGALQNTISAEQATLSSGTITDYQTYSQLDGQLISNEVKQISGQATSPMTDQIMTIGGAVLLIGEMLLMSLAYRTASKSKMDKLDTKLTLSELSQATASDTYVTNSLVSQSVFDKAWVASSRPDQATTLALLPLQIGGVASDTPGGGGDSDIPYVQNQIEAIFGIVNNKVNTDVKNQKQQVYTTITTNLTIDGDLDPTRSIDYGLTISSLPSNDSSDTQGNLYNSGSDPVSVFPVFGTPYNAPNTGISAIISGTMTNSTQFGDNEVLINQNLSQPTSTGGSTYELIKNPKRAPMFKGWGIFNSTTNKWESDPLHTFTQQTPFSDYIRNTVNVNAATAIKNGNQPIGTVKFFIEKLHGTHKSGEPNQRGIISSQNTMNGSDTNQDLDNRRLFSAYIDSYSESYNPSWDTYNFIGRGEGVPIYKSTSRKFNITFNIIADYSLDILTGMTALYQQLGYTVNQADQLDSIINTSMDWGLGYIGQPYKSDSNNDNLGPVPGKYSDTTETLWQKTTFLAQCCYAYYRLDGKMKEQPMIRLRVGDFYDVVGYIDSLNVDSNEFDNVLDLNPSNIGNIPFAVKITMSMTILHDNEPSSNFYGFYNRREFDTGLMGTDGTGITIPDGVTSNGVISKSPLAFKGKQPQGKITDTPSLISSGDMNTLVNGISDFSSSFTQVAAKGINIQDATVKVSLQKAMNAYINVANVAGQLATQYGTQLNAPSGMAGDVTAFKGNNTYGNVSNNLLAANPSQIDKVKNNASNSKSSNDPLYGSNNALNVNGAQSSNTKGPGPNASANNIVATPVVSSTPQAPKTFADIFSNTN